MARRAGSHAEMRVVTRQTATAASRARGFSTRRICTALPVKNMPVKASRRHQSVMPMPTQPTISPMGIPTPQSSSAS